MSGASAAFAIEHLHFEIEMEAEGFVSLARADCGVQPHPPPHRASIETESWGERYIQVADPNGVVYQYVQWLDG